MSLFIYFVFRLLSFPLFLWTYLKCSGLTINATIRYLRVFFEHEMFRKAQQAKASYLSFNPSSHVSPIIRNGLETVLKRRRSGTEAKAERRINGGITAFELRRSLLQKEKQNFYTTRQLITRSVVMMCASENYSGDSFRFTRHPLITLMWYIVLI